MTDNELIAEFMKLDKHPNNQRAYWIEDQDCYLTFDNLQFHHSWNQLMPVVEKIETLYDTGVFYDGLRGPDVHNVRIYAKRGGSETIVIAYGKSKIETTYNAVVQFIKWYNSQK